MKNKENNTSKSTSFFGLIETIFSKDNRNTAKTWIEKFNDNLDKVTAFRDKVAIRALIAWTIFGAMFALHYFDVMTTLAIITQVLSATYGVVTGAITIAFFMAEMYVTSKVGAVVGLVCRNGFIADEITDRAVEKFRNTKTQPQEAKTAEAA